MSLGCSDTLLASSLALLVAAVVGVADLLGLGLLLPVPGHLLAFVVGIPVAVRLFAILPVLVVSETCEDIFLIGLDCLEESNPAFSSDLGGPEVSLGITVHLLVGLIEFVEGLAVSLLLSASAAVVEEPSELDRADVIVAEGGGPLFLPGAVFLDLEGRGSGDESSSSEDFHCSDCFVVL